MPAYQNLKNFTPAQYISIYEHPKHSHISQAPSLENNVSKTEKNQYEVLPHSAIFPQNKNNSCKAANQFLPNALPILQSIKMLA